MPTCVSKCTSMLDHLRLRAHCSSSFRRSRIQLFCAAFYTTLLLLVQVALCSEYPSSSHEQPRFSSPARARDTLKDNDTIPNERKIRVVFSDVDGTLVHYPETVDTQKRSDGNSIVALPPSSTGMRGIISSRTLSQCQKIRHGSKTSLVIISGMRTSTLLKRLPYLPRADAYCCEAGGRIFYPIQIDEHFDGVIIKPHPYDGVLEKDLTAFGLVEDLTWRSRMERPQAAGSDGYVGVDLRASKGDPIHVSKREGLLWSFARSLIAKGFALDTKGYSSCFRVNRKQQKVISEEEFHAFASGEVAVPNGLSTSTNLGCVDFYPSESGKKNCCVYLGKKFCNTEDDSVLLKHAVCLCDDDNDLEMALACERAYIPRISSTSMAKAVQDYPNKLLVTGGGSGTSMEGTSATEVALALVLERLTA